MVVVVVVGFFGSFRVLSDAVPPDPNEPDQDGQIPIDILEGDVRRMYQRVALQKHRKRLNQAEADGIFLEFVRERARGINLALVSSKQAYRFGEILRTARMWPEAKRAFERAVSVAGQNQDRRVNDTLRLAHCEAELGNVRAAVQLTVSTFDAPPGNKPPILLAVLLEIVPAAEKNGGNPAILAGLLMQSVEQHLRAEVVADSTAGRAFFSARPYHVRNACEKAIELYTKAGRTEEVKQIQDYLKMLFRPANSD